MKQHQSYAGYPMHFYIFSTYFIRVDLFTVYLFDRCFDMMLGYF